MPENFWYDIFQASTQARNHGGRRGAMSPLEKILTPLERCVGRSLKILDIVQKTWAPLGKLFAPYEVPSWLRACFSMICFDKLANDVKFLGNKVNNKIISRNVRISKQNF